MVRPREFNREDALDSAMRVFWAKGYASTSTDDLLAAMQIGRQSLYNAFGDKRKLYLEAFEHYVHSSVAGHIERLTRGTSPLAGIKALLLGVVAEDAAQRALGCMGVNSVCEFGTTDGEINRIRAAGAKRLTAALHARVVQARLGGEIDPQIDVDETTLFLGGALQMLQVQARGGMSVASLRRMVDFTLTRLTTRG